MPNLSSPRRVASVLTAALVLAGCTYGGEPQDPVSRRMSYFSFLAADDIRTACDSGVQERYRFVYNAEYSVQVRVYEIAVDPASGEGRLVTRVLGGERLGPFQFNFQSWLIEQASTRTMLRPRDVQLVRDTLAAAAFTVPPPHLVALWSDDYYWLVSGCVAGAFYQNGYAYPSERYRRLGFARVLGSYDESGIPFAERPPGDARVTARRVPHRAQDASTIEPFVYYIEP
ncbi:MAG: hypothetical protein AB7P52_02070 [Alphaproteobacteria bacterium]